MAADTADQRLRDPVRLQAIAATGLSAATSAPTLDRLTGLAARWLNASVALVTFVDAESQFFVGVCGSDGDRRTPLSRSFCQFVVTDDAPLIVADVRADDRLRDNPAVADGILAYAGIPLRTPAGDVLGSFCVADNRPRTWTDTDLATLTDLAAAAEAEIAARLARTALETERQRLADERTFLQTLLDSLDTGVVACDGDGRLALFNQALLRMHGTSLQPLDVETWAQAYDLYGSDGRTPLEPDQNPLTRAFAGQVVEGQELVIAAPGVAARRFLANGRAIDTLDGRRVGAVVAMHDITDAHRTETLRRAQNTVAQALADATSAHEAVRAAITAVAGALDWTCAEYWDLSGNGPPHRVGDASPATAADVPTLVRAVAQQQAPVTERTEGNDRAERTDSCAGPIRIGLPVRAVDTISGVIVFCLDAGGPHPDTYAMLDSVCARIGRYLERRRVEDLALALAAAQRDFERVAAQIDDYLWTMEIRPDGQARSVYGSPNAVAIFGGDLPADADLATALAERVHPDDAEAFAAFHRAIRDGQSSEIESRVRGIDGRTRWIWTRAVARQEHECLLVDGISTDVTERRTLAEQRERLLTAEQQQVARLRELDRMKDELVAVVSHELRNPIGTIRGYTELLLDDPGLPAEHRSHAAVIDRTSAHLKQLADQLLDLARIDAGHIRLDARPLSLTRLVREAVFDHRPVADAKGIRIDTDLPPTLPAHGDATRLRQVLDNLLSNAIKYTPDGGTVSVCGSAGETGVSVTVTDTGIGVPAEQLGQLFTRFFRATTALDLGIKGTGLGLAVTKAIVEAHHGTITAEPAGPHGTRFRIRLPGGARAAGDSAS